MQHFFDLQKEWGKEPNPEGGNRRRAFYSVLRKHEKIGFDAAYRIECQSMELLTVLEDKVPSQARGCHDRLEISILTTMSRMFVRIQPSKTTGGSSGTLLSLMVTSWLEERLEKFLPIR